MKCKSKPQWDITSHLQEWLKSKRQEITNVDKDVEKNEPSCTAGRSQIGTGTVENVIQFPQKIKNKITIWSSNSTTEYLPK